MQSGEKFYKAKGAQGNYFYFPGICPNKRWKAWFVIPKLLNKFIRLKLLGECAFKNFVEPIHESKVLLLKNLPSSFQFLLDSFLKSHFIHAYIFFNLNKNTSD